MRPGIGILDDFLGGLVSPLAKHSNIDDLTKLYLTKKLKRTDLSSQIFPTPLTSETKWVRSSNPVIAGRGVSIRNIYLIKNEEWRHRNPGKQCAFIQPQYSLNASLSPSSVAVGLKNETTVSGRIYCIIIV